MRTLLFLIALISFIRHTHAVDSAAETWVNRYNGTGNGKDVPNAVVTDSIGNVVVSGYSTGPGDIFDLYVAKYAAANGSILWQNRFRGPDNLGGSALSVIVDSEDNVIVTGTIAYNGQASDIYTVKYRGSDGGFLWSRRYTGVSLKADIGRRVLVDQNNDVFVVGEATTVSSPFDYQDFYVGKYSGIDGSVLWEKTYTRNDHSRDIAYDGVVDQDGGVIVTGDSDNDIFTIKYDAAGLVLWQKRLNGPSNGNDFPTAIAIDPGGNAIVTGVVTTLGFSTNYLTIKYGKMSGDIMWMSQYNGLGNGQDHPNALAVDADGNPIVTGWSSSGLSYDFCTIKYSATDGSILWERREDIFSYEDTANGVIIDAAGNAIVTGHTLNADGKYDFHTIKYASADGSIIWRNNYDDPDHLDDQMVFSTFVIPKTLARTGDGGAVITGASYNSSNQDFVTIRYTPTNQQTLAPSLLAPPPNSAITSSVGVAFKLPEYALPGTVTLSIGDTILHLASSEESAGFHSFAVDLHDLTASTHVASIEGGPVLDGLHDITLSYRNALGYSSNSVTSTHVTVDTSTQTPVIGAPVSNSRFSHLVPISFTLPEQAKPGTVVLQFGSHALLISDQYETAGNHQFTFDPSNPTASSVVKSGAPIPDGAYTVVLSYFDALGNGAAQAQVSPIVIDTVTEQPTIASPNGAAEFGRIIHISFILPEEALPGSVVLDLSGQLFTLSSTLEAAGEHEALFDFTSPSESPDIANGNPIRQGIYSLTLSYRDKLGNPAATTTTLSGIRLFSTPIHSAISVAGENVPGAGPGTMPPGAIWASFGIPTLIDAGNSVGFSAKLKTPNGAISGIFSGPVSSPLLRLKVGAPATDSLGEAITNVTFRSFKEPVFATQEHWAVIAKLKGNGISVGNEEGIWIGTPTGYSKVAMAGEIAPGANGSKFKSFVSILHPSPEFLVFTARLAGKASANDIGLWTWTPEKGITLQIRRGSGVFPSNEDLSGTVQSFRSLQPVAGSPGHGRYDETSFGALLTFQDGEQAIAKFDSSGIASYVVTDSELSTNVSATKFGIPCWQPETSAYAVLAKLNGDTGSQLDLQAILKDGTVIAKEGDPAPLPENARFKTFLDPVFGVGANNQSFLAFSAILKGPQPKRDTAIFGYDDSSSNLYVVAQEGDELPGSSGITWKKFTSLSVIAGRGALFTAELSGRGVSSANDKGLWAQDSSGQLRLLFREGQLISGRFLTHFDVLGIVAGSSEQRRAWNPNSAVPTVIWRANFANGESALVTTRVP